MAGIRPAKRTKMFSDNESSDDEGADGGVKLSAAGNEHGFSINQAYAQRFEHNKKREELQQLEEKYKASTRNKRGREEIDSGSEDDESTSESEDDDAELATADLDAEIMDTLQAIRNKDPRVYNKDVKFYKDFDPNTANHDGRKEKPMYLQDYHRQNLLSGHTGAEQEEEEEEEDDDGNGGLVTYQQEQDTLRRELVGSMHANAARPSGDDESEDDDGFMVKKEQPKHDSLAGVSAARSAEQRLTDADIANAEKDPETFLSNFMAARAWLPTQGSRFTAMDSDDSDEEQRAEAYEEAYNMRFEDPNAANEKLQMFARDVGKYSARREETSKRKRARDAEREKRDAIKRERDAEKARLRKLKIDEAEEKVKKIKEAAGLVGQDVDLKKWRDIIEGDFVDEEWDKEMAQRFGDGYYEAKEANGKAKKPSWDDDIDIGDLVPDFDEEGSVTASGPDSEEMIDPGAAHEEPVERKLSKKDHERANAEAKRVARKQRAQIASMVDDSLATDPTHSTTGLRPGFKYRETSPTSFGLTARDILFAEDKQLNDYAGLKKLAAFRDDDKKRRDRKRYSKKARLREWRKETFGSADGPSIDLPESPTTQDQNNVHGAEEESRDKKKKKKRRQGKKTAVEA